MLQVDVVHQQLTDDHIKHPPQPQEQQPLTYHNTGSSPASTNADDGVSPEVPPTLAEFDQDSAPMTHKMTIDALVDVTTTGYEDIHESLESAMEAEADQEPIFESEPPAPAVDDGSEMDMDVDDMDVDGKSTAMMNADDNGEVGKEGPVVQVNGRDLGTPPVPVAVEPVPVLTVAPSNDSLAAPVNDSVDPSSSPAYGMNQLDLSPIGQSSQSPAAAGVAIGSPRMQDEHEDERPSKRARNSYDEPMASSTSPPPPLTPAVPPTMEAPPPTLAIDPAASMITPSFPPSPVPPPQHTGPPTFTPNQQKFATSIVRTLKKSKDAIPFLAPVDPVVLNIPHYPSVIKHPMDFGTIERKLNASKKGTDVGQATYKTAEEFIGDVRLVFENCFAFNGRQHIVSQMSERLQDTFEKQIKHLPAPEETSSAPSPVATKASSPAVSKPPKPIQRRPSMANTSSAIKTDPSLLVNNRPKREIQPSTSYEAGSSKYGPNGVGRRPRNDGAVEQLKFCGKILTDLYKKQYSSFAYFFYDPVDATLVPNYYKVIKRPMDLSTMRKKLDNHEYSDASRFYADFNQIVKNCFTFNPEGSTVREAGVQLQRVFEEKWAALPSLNSDDDDDVDSEEDKSDEERSTLIRQLEQQVATLNQSIQSLKAHASEKKKRREREREQRIANRKAAAAAKAAQKPRTSSFSSSSAAYQPKANGSSSKHHANGKPKTSTKKGKEPAQPEGPSPPPFDDLDSPLDNAQKKELSEAIEQLEGSKLEKVINIIQEGVPGIGNQNSEEIELEIDALPAIVLTKLYNFVVRPLKNPNFAAKPKPTKRVGSGNTGRTGAAATGGVKRKSMDEVAEAEKIRSLEEKQRLLAGGAPTQPQGPGMGAGADEEDSVQSESDSGSESDSDSD